MRVIGRPKNNIVSGNVHSSTSSLFFSFITVRQNSCWKSFSTYWTIVSTICHFAQSLACTSEPGHNKTNKMSVRPVKTQISLDICPVWSESSLCIQWVAKDLSFLHADSEDSDQTGWMPRLIWVFAGHTLILLILSCCGSSNWIKKVDKTPKHKTHKDLK